MVKFTNSTTGSVMWVAENRVKEYIEAGHKPASDTVTGSHEEKPETAPVQKPGQKKSAGKPKKAEKKK